MQDQQSQDELNRLMARANFQAGDSAACWIFVTEARKTLIKELWDYSNKKEKVLLARIFSALERVNGQNVCYEWPAIKAGLDLLGEVEIEDQRLSFTSSYLERVGRDRISAYLIREGYLYKH